MDEEIFTSERARGYLLRWDVNVPNPIAKPELIPGTKQRRMVAGARVIADIRAAKSAAPKLDLDAPTSK